MHLFPFTSHLRGLDRAPHVKQEYQNAKKKKEEEKEVYSKNSFS